MAHRASVNQQVQIGPESVPCTSVPAGKLLKAFNWSMGAKPTTKQFTGTGAKYPSASEEMTEEAAGKISGEADYQAMVYPVSSVFGKTSPTLHTGASLANDWKYTPILTGVQNPQTYTMQQGDTVEAEQYTYLIFTGFGYSITRKDAISVSGDWISQSLTAGATLTPTPTTIAQYPMVGKQFNIYLDSTSTGIGTTQLSNVLKADFNAGGYYGEFWPLNRANASFTSTIDAMPKDEMKLTLEADPTAMAILSTYLQTGNRVYMRVDGVGALIENDQIVAIGAASAGTFTLTYKGQTTSAITFNALASAVQTALRGLSTIGATGCTVSGTAPTWTVLMTGALANDVTALTINGGSLTGGTPLVTAQPINAAMRHDMCLFVTDIADFSDADGIYATEYTMVVAEDTAWASGQSQVLTLTNLLSAL
jgi:hypothetical protein